MGRGSGVRSANRRLEEVEWCVRRGVFGLTKASEKGFVGPKIDGRGASSVPPCWAMSESMEAREARFMATGDLGRCSLALMPRPRAASGGVGGTRWACHSVMRWKRCRALVPDLECSTTKGRL